MEPWLAQRKAEVTCTRFFADPSLPPSDGIERLIVMGGPMSVHDEASLPWLRSEKAFIREAIRRNARVLGVCLGAQLIAEALGGTVTRNREREIGWFPVTRVPDASGAPFAEIFPAEFEAFHWHGETFSPPPGATRLLRSAACAQQAFAFGPRVLALQFHLETTPAGARALIENGRDDLRAGNFVQPERDILADSARFAALSPVLSRVLSALFPDER